MRKLQSRWEWAKNKEKRVGKFKNKENIIKYKTREIVEIKKKKKKKGGRGEKIVRYCIEEKGL